MSREPSPPLTDEAVTALREAVGAEHVVLSGPALDRAGVATFATSHGPVAVVRPGSREEVQAVVRVARRLGLHLYPVSTGRNWGFGSRVPPRPGAVLVDLGRMDRIVELDDELGTLTVEPGVTFEAAHRALAERGASWMLSSTGASPRSSLVGNALERGDGAGPLGDRFAHATALEVVLPTGECVHTGFARFEGSRTATLHRWGVGPALEGLFSQSRFGIVTRMTFWLSPLPRSLHLLRFEVDTEARLGPLVDGLRRLRMDGTIRAPVGIWNDCRVASTLMQYPWDLTGGATPLSEAHLARLREEIGPARWYGVTALYAASAEQGEAHLEHAEEALRPLADRLHVEEHHGDAIARHAAPGSENPALRFFRGVPHEGSLHSLYWRKRTPVPAELDPERDRCGVIWVCPVLPFRGRDVLEAVGPARDTMRAHGFDPLLAMIAQTDRTMYLVPLVIYDRDVPGEDERARACHDALFTGFCAQGFHPHRLGIQSMDSLPAAADDHAALMERLTRALDPGDVLAPGRYDFTRPRAGR